MSGLIGDITSKSGIVNQPKVDYETGTWTPDLQASSSDATRSAGGSNGGYYVKVGNIVHISGEMNIVISSGSYGGVLKMTGLPFIVRQAGAISVSYYNGWSLGGNYGLTLWPYANQTFCYIFHNTSGTTASTQLNNGNRSGATQTMIFGGSYYTA